MRTIRECIADSLEPIDEVYTAFALSGFIQSMACVVTGVTWQLLMNDMPTLEIEGEEAGGGKGKDDIRALDILRVLGGVDLLRGTTLTLQIQRFLVWFLDQDEPDDEEGITIWWDERFVGDMWNTFAVIYREEDYE